MKKSVHFHKRDLLHIFLSFPKSDLFLFITGESHQNLKKSWHPQTLKNIERVWKAEQKHEAERKKIEELQKELKDERAREEMTRYAQETGAVKCVTFSQPQHHAISLQKRIITHLYLKNEILHLKGLCFQ